MNATVTAGERPSRATSRRARLRDDALAEGGEAQLIAAARRGDAEAFETLYALHSADVCRLARRLCTSSHEADDVTSEVFCNTLRALQRGAGPSDLMGPYLLRSVRNTVIKLRTRTDSAHTAPASPETLDRPDDRDPFFAPGPAVTAFRAVSERHRSVLWSVEVEGASTAAVAQAERLAPPAAASLAYRARCALRRAFIGASIPATGVAECIPVRSLMATYVDDGLSASKSATMLAHVGDCDDCAKALESAQRLRSGLGNKSPFALLLIWFRTITSLADRAVTGLLAVSPVAAIGGTAALAVGLGAIVDVESQPDTMHAAVEIAAADERTAPDHSSEQPGFAPNTAPMTRFGVPTDSEPARSAVETAPLPVPDASGPEWLAPEGIDVEPGLGAHPGIDGIDAPFPVPTGDDVITVVDTVTGTADTVTNSVTNIATNTVSGVVDGAVGTTGDVVSTVVEVVVDTVDATGDVIGTVGDVVEVVGDATQPVTDLAIVTDVIDVVDVVTEQPVTQTVDQVATDAVGAVEDTVVSILDVTGSSDDGADDGLLGVLGIGR